MKYYGGVIIEAPSPTDFIAGSTSPIVPEPLLINGDWRPYASQNERQQILLSDGSRIETNGCTNFTSVHHVVGTRLNLLLANGILSTNYPAAYDFLCKNGYVGADGKVDLSERYGYIKSGTNPNEGNSGSKVSQSFRNFGIVPGSVLPNDGCTSIQEYVTSSPQADALGQESLKYFDFSWQVIPPDQTDKWMVTSPLMWFIPVCPGYSEDNPVKTCNDQIQHAVGKIAVSDPNKHVLDSYAPFLKDLAPDYSTPYAFQIIVKPIPQLPPPGIPQAPKYLFKRDMVMGERSQDVLHLQDRLGIPQTGIYDDATRIAVFKFQLNNLSSVFREMVVNLVGRRVGPRTRMVLNK